MCDQAPAWVSTAAGDRWLGGSPGTCFQPAPLGGWMITSAGGGPLVSPETPRLVLRVGETVTVHFTAPPQSGLRSHFNSVQFVAVYRAVAR